jgi:hypothetical protein
MTSTEIDEESAIVLGERAGEGLTHSARNVEDVEVFKQESHVLDTFLGGLVSRKLLVLSQPVDEFRSACGKDNFQSASSLPFAHQTRPSTQAT